MIKNKIKFILLGVFIVSIFFVFDNFSFAQNSPDAISIRVIPNPAHYSPQRWYNEQGFIGTPQQLLVDGYDAVRNGNTVYVNAANIAGTVPTLFTNIYIISYNLEADRETEDIFARILDNWKFNSNISSSPGHCFPDFPADVCLTSTDCASGSYCSSDKSETIRDTFRLANIAELKIALDEYKEKNGNYPSLSAGSYLPNRSISTWPSWEGTFLKELGIKSVSDPINDLGLCPGYNEDTCWSEEDKEFADADLADPALNLPSGSKAFVYEVQPDGSEFDICAEMESGFVFGESNGACSEPDNTAGIVGEVTNYPPQIIDTNIPSAYIGHPYVAYVQGMDPNEDYISWSLDTSGTTWTNWSAQPSLVFTVLNEYIKIEANIVGNQGSYPFSVTLDDGRGGILTETFTIDVFPFPPIINISPFTFPASSTKQVEGSFTVKHDPFNVPLNINLMSSLPDNLGYTFLPETDNRYKFYFSGSISSASNVILDGVKTYSHNFFVNDSAGNSSNDIIQINVVNHKPEILEPSCNMNLRVDVSSCPLPWGEILQNGESVTAYQQGTVLCNGTCVPETRVCTNGELSGSYTNPTCDILNCSATCDVPWSNDVLLDGEEYQAARESTVECGMGSCEYSTRKCENGVLLGDPSYDKSNLCFDNYCSVPGDECIDGSCGCTMYTYGKYDVYTECDWIDPTIHCIAPWQTPVRGFCENIGQPDEYKMIECEVTGNFDIASGNCCYEGICDGMSVFYGDDGDPRNVGSGPIINSLVADPNPWFVNLGSSTFVTVTADTDNADVCSWCGESIPCDGSKVIEYEAPSVWDGRQSCLFRAKNSATNEEVVQRGYTEIECTAIDQIKAEFQGLVGGGECDDGNDFTSCPNTTDCSSFATSCTFVSEEHYSLYTDCSWTSDEHCNASGQSIKNAYCRNPGTASEYKVIECNETGGTLDGTGTCCNANYCENDTWPDLGSDGDPRNNTFVHYGEPESATGPGEGFTAFSLTSECPDDYTPVSCEWGGPDLGTDYFNNIEIWNGSSDINLFGACVLDGSNNGYKLQLGGYDATMERYVRSVCMLSSEFEYAPQGSVAESAGTSVTGTLSSCSPAKSPFSVEWSNDNGTTWYNLVELEGGMSVGGISGSVLTKRVGNGYLITTSNYSFPLVYRTICVNNSIYDVAPDISFTGEIDNLAISPLESTCDSGYVPFNCEWKESSSSEWLGNIEIFGGEPTPSNSAISCVNQGGNNVGHRLRMERTDLTINMHAICVKQYQ